MKLSPNCKLLFIGDSITACGRGPDGEEHLHNQAPSLGNGYVSLVNALLGASFPQLHVRVLNRGLGGNTILDLKDRWREDVLDQKPEWLSVMIGINDVWRQFDRPLAKETHVSPERYREVYRSLLAATRSSLEGLVLATPYMIEPNRQDPMRARMDEYAQIVHELAQEFDAVLVDTQASFDAILESRHPMSLAWDRIHPSATGHMVIAQAFMAALTD